jgi:hypothetical protein
MHPSRAQGMSWTALLNQETKAVEGRHLQEHIFDKRRSRLAAGTIVRASLDRVPSRSHLSLLCSPLRAPFASSCATAVHVTRVHLLCAHLGVPALYVAHLVACPAIRVRLLYVCYCCCIHHSPRHAHTCS